MTGAGANAGTSTINRLARPLGGRLSMGGARGVAPRASPAPGAPSAAVVAAADTPRGAAAGVAGGSGSSCRPVAAGECGEEDGEGLSEAELQQRREANIKALLSNRSESGRRTTVQAQRHDLTTDPRAALHRVPPLWGFLYTLCVLGGLT